LLGPDPLDERNRYIARAASNLRLVLGAFDRLDILHGRHVFLQVIEQGRIEHGGDDRFDRGVEDVLETEVHGRESLLQRYRFGSARLDFTLRMGPRMLMDIESSSTLPDTSTEPPSEKGPPPTSSKISPRSV